MLLLINVIKRKLYQIKYKNHGLDKITVIALHHVQVVIDKYAISYRH